MTYAATGAIDDRDPHYIRRVRAELAQLRIDFYARRGEKPPAKPSYRKRYRKAGGRSMTRGELVTAAVDLRAQGLIVREIAERLGVSRSYAYELLTDPDGTRAKERKARYAGECVDCGAHTSGSEGRRAEPRCRACARLGKGRWTKEELIARIREWNTIYGEPPAAPDWTPSKARHMNDEARARRYEEAEGHWPGHMTLVNHFGSWNAAIAAAGFTPRVPDGRGGIGRHRTQRGGRAMREMAA